MKLCSNIELETFGKSEFKKIFLLVLNMVGILLFIMTKATLTFGFILVFSLFTVGLSSGLLQQVEAYPRTLDSETTCRTGQVLVYHVNFRKFICTSESGAAQWIRHGIAEMVGEITPSGEKQLEKSDFAKSSPETIRHQELATIFQKIADGERISKSEQRMADRAQQFIESQQTAEEFYGRDSSGVVSTSDPTQPSSTQSRVSSGTITSMDDPGMGHSEHEIAIILPPSDKTYIGRMTFSASEPVQYVTLIGPLGPGENAGQKTWTPDGETYYALVLVDQGSKSGGWAFAGNALALHTMNSEPFTATYSVSYVELAPGVYDRGTVGTGTIQSGPDPAIGHEGHSLAIILEPRDIPYQGGFFAYSASENIQLVALHGPLGPGDDMGQDTWELDDGTKFALTFIDVGGSNGVWTTFSGNALAVHTLNPDGFTVSYAIGGLH